MTTMCLLYHIREGHFPRVLSSWVAGEVKVFHFHFSLEGHVRAHICCLLPNPSIPNPSLFQNYPGKQKSKLTTGIRVLIVFKKPPLFIHPNKGRDTDTDYKRVDQEDSILSVVNRPLTDEGLCEVPRGARFTDSN